MISTEDIRDKEVINIYDGRSMGYVDDLEVDLERGVVEGLVVFARRRFLSFLGQDEDMVIPWQKVRRVGEDVVLADMPEAGSGPPPIEINPPRREESGVEEQL
ncbi:MAG: YlmC/YmxH family sporulation protein [Bacillota bacterium]|nr:YlmC/YmxH family sporulation protein [Bacillota bacterium]